MQLQRMGSIVPRVECQLQHSITVTWPFAYQMIQRQRHGAIFAASSRKLRIFAFYGASCTTPRPSTTPTSIRPTRIRNKTKIAARKQCDSNWKKPTIDCQLVTGARYASPYLMVKYSSSKNAIDLDIELY